MHGARRRTLANAVPGVVCDPFTVRGLCPGGAVACEGEGEGDGSEAHVESGGSVLKDIREGRCLLHRSDPAASYTRGGSIVCCSYNYNALYNITFTPLYITPRLGTLRPDVVVPFALVTVQTDVSK